MHNAPELRKIKSSGGRDEGDLLVLFGESAVEMVLRFIDRARLRLSTSEDQEALDLSSAEAVLA